MRILPPGRTDLLLFVRTHLPQWQQDPGAVGLADSQVADLAALLDESEAANFEARTQRLAARNATLASNIKLGELRDSTARALGSIKAFAREQSAAGPEGGNVYTAAGIDVPLRPAPLPAPEPVQDVRAVINTYGAPTLSWKPPHPRDARERAAGNSAIIYTVQRRLLGERAFTIVHVGKPARFTDAPLPPGQTQYMVRATRGGRHGDWSRMMTIEIGGSGVGDAPGTLELAA